MCTLKYLTTYKCYFSSYASNARGVAVLFNKIHKIKTDSLENVILIDITIEGEQITLANICGPNDDNILFIIIYLITLLNLIMIYRYS